MVIVKVIGGLGNQMFQYAFYRSLKEIYSNTKLDVLSFENYHLHNGFELENIFKNIKTEYANPKEIKEFSDCKKGAISNIRRKLFGVKQTYYCEEYLGYNKSIKNNTANMYFDGYWQSEKYFLDIENVIRKEFTFIPFNEKKNILMSNKMSQTNSICIHIRRGDYVNHPLYSNICNLEYYQNAIDYMKNNIANPFFYVFSDDISWCQNTFNITTQVDYIDWNKGNKSYRDMQLMSMCKHNIIANSTFSWWGAWLNSHPDKIVVAPKRILNSDNDVVDLIPENWIRI
ncbi:alpha-1,2-fucosyltransferase [Paenibacillus sp. GP183]|uniref:alpha-1,2-fucosyltransferase n=1 Tax=Paenibacillus sp. GP183 TaxID=1882751 RepID=UPI00089B9C99|nr:alpha-1,2-fucosyltransferase [Paenibacillus sp. GP183]SEC11181.1 Glycosyl transferase family 11 [Paenibacillus sp. GP183]